MHSCRPESNCGFLCKADEALAASTGNAFQADPDQHAWRFGMEPVTGLTLSVSSLVILQLSYHPPSASL